MRLMILLICFVLLVGCGSSPNEMANSDIVFNETKTSGTAQEVVGIALDDCYVILTSTMQDNARHCNGIQN